MSNTNEEESQAAFEWRVYLEQQQEMEHIMTTCISPITHCVECGEPLNPLRQNPRCPDCTENYRALTDEQRAQVDRDAAARLIAEDKAKEAAARLEIAELKAKLQFRSPLPLPEYAQPGQPVDLSDYPTVKQAIQWYTPQQEDK